MNEYTPHHPSYHAHTWSCFLYILLKDFSIKKRVTLTSSILCIVIRWPHGRSNFSHVAHRTREIVSTYLAQCRASMHARRPWPGRRSVEVSTGARHETRRLIDGALLGGGGKCPRGRRIGNALGSLFLLTNTAMCWAGLPSAKAN